MLLGSFRNCITLLCVSNGAQPSNAMPSNRQRTKGSLLPQTKPNQVVSHHVSPFLQELRFAGSSGNRPDSRNASVFCLMLPRLSIPIFLKFGEIPKKILDLCQNVALDEKNGNNIVESTMAFLSIFSMRNRREVQKNYQKSSLILPLSLFSH